ncbi:MAG: proton-conducting transporter membrane subunit, partial [Terriglobales bacterium]
VYEGAPTPVTAFLSIGSKAGGFVIALRLLTAVFSKSTADWVLLFSILAAASMIMGNLIALAQSSVKRMLAYSSIAHIGYILIGLIAGPQIGYSAVMFYLAVYGLMNLGAFAGVILVQNEIGSDRIEDFSGLIRKRPWLALGLSLCLLNLAGLPIPPAGFLAKVFVFGAGLQIPIMIGQVNIGWVLVLIGLATSIPAVYYYTRVIIKMIVRDPSERVEALGPDRGYFDSPQMMPMWALGICSVAIIAAGTFGVDPLMKLSKMAVAPLNQQSPTATPIGLLPGRNKLFE